MKATEEKAALANETLKFRNDAIQKINSTLDLAVMETLRLQCLIIDYREWLYNMFETRITPLNDSYQIAINKLTEMDEQGRIEAQKEYEAMAGKIKP